MRDVSTTETRTPCYRQEIEQVCTDPTLATDALRLVASHVRHLQRATVFYRFLLGRQLIAIKQNQLWRQMERRDYCKEDPNGIPLWGNNEKNRFHSSWYDFIDQGFEFITGLHRETAYSAIKLAESTTLSTLPLTELRNFTRLANALQMVTAERRGLKITSELIQKARDMTMRQFRQTIQARARGTPRTEGLTVSDTKESVRSKEALAMLGIIRFFKTASTRNVDAVDSFWALLQRAMLNLDQDPVRVLESITNACLELGREPE